MSERGHGRVREALGDEAFERLTHLDRARAGGTPRPDAPLTLDEGARPDVDVVFAGGGLSLLVACALARRGVSVAVLDRARVGAAHREWNASGAELEVLVREGLVTRPELEALVVARYDAGLCRFGAGASHRVRGVLDHAVDGRALLAALRDRAVRDGVRVLDGASVEAVGEGPSAVAVRARDGSGTTTLVARVLCDARGAASPSATADLVCPTVGGVLRGLAHGDAPDEVDPRVGDILVTTEGVVDGRQHVWEGFPARAGELTTYLFHYARRGEESSLVALYERFFRARERYKRAAGGGVELVRPTFGYIPGWTRFGPRPRPPGARTVLVGDAAALHSPLTFCGFGAMLRSFAPTAARVAARVEGRPAVEPSDEPVHALTGALAALMARPPADGEALNELLDAAFATLAELGEPAYASLLQDRMGPEAFVDFLRRTSRRRPAVYGEVLRGLGPAALLGWGASVATGLVRARRARAASHGPRNSP